MTADGEVEALREAHDNMIAWMSMNAPYRHMTTFRDCLARLTATTYETAKLRERVEELEGALRPFADFEETLRSWHSGKYDPPFSEEQREWPSHQPVLRRTRPEDSEKMIVRTLMRDDFDRARSALENSPATLADATPNQKDRSNV